MFTFHCQRMKQKYIRSAMCNPLNSKGINIVFSNIRSLLNKIEDVREKLHDENISILVISESWLKSAIPNTLMDINGYTLHRQDRDFTNVRGYRKRGGGIVIYVKNSLSFDIVSDNMFSMSNCDIEFNTIRINRPHTRHLYIVSVNRPPTGKVSNCIDALESCLKFLPKLDKSDIVIGGDFNINYAKPRQDNTKKLKHFANQNQFTQYIKDPTRPLQNDFIIDLIFSNCQNIQNSGSLSWNLSDHIPVFIKIKKTKCVPEKVEFRGRSYRQFDANNFIHSLNNKNWNIFNASADADIKWDNLYQNILETLDQQIPVKTFIFPKSKPEWLVGDLVEYMKDRDSLLKKARRTRKLEDKKAANKARNKTNKLIKNAKNTFIKDKLRDFQNNPKIFWEQIKSTYPSDKVNNPIQFTNKDGNSLNNKQTAHLVNEYFTNIGPNLAKAAQEMAKTRPNFPQANGMDIDLHQPKFIIQYPTRAELIKRINDIKVFKSSGLPLVSSRIWKLILQNNPDFLYDILTAAIDSNIYPRGWKKATVVPIPKISKPIGPEDLRPISLLPLPGKIFEHLIHSQMDSYLENNNLLTVAQNGFRTKHSTIQTIFDYLSELTEAYNNNLDTIAVYIDFKKAFDTVNHKILLDKLKTFNFDDSTSKLLKSYLTNRLQSTFINGSTSEEGLITYGVPQGSVLGPKLFLMFINDLTTCIKNCKYFLYADDIVMFKTLDSQQRAYDLRRFQDDILAIENWCLQNELTINIKKTKTQFFPANNNFNCAAFENDNICRIYEQDLSFVSTFKYLGVDIDRHLNFKSCYDSMYKLVNHKLYLLKLIRPALTVQAALSVGKSMILSLIDYGNIFLTILTQEDKSDLQKAQNKVLRCCLDITDPLDMNILEMHNVVNVDLVDERRTHNLLTMTHRNVKTDKFKMLDHQINTRYNDGNKIELIRPRNEQVRKSCYYTGTSLWNTLNLNLKPKLKT